MPVPPAPDLRPPAAVWVSLGAAGVAVMFLWAPALFAVFGVGVSVVAVVAGWEQKGEWWQARVGTVVGGCMAVLLGLLMLA